MARTPSNMLPLGTPAPAFSLPDPASGETVSIKSASGKPLLVVFMCNHCPFVIHIMEAFTQLANELVGRGVSVVAISANDVDNFPDDSPEKMAALAREQGFSFPYLYDASQEVARAYDAACTPDFYLFDAAHTLVYRGQFDAARPGNGVEVTGRDLREAAEALLAGERIADEQIPSVGCSIKWID